MQLPHDKTTLPSAHFIIQKPDTPESIRDPPRYILFSKKKNGSELPETLMPFVGENEVLCLCGLPSLKHLCFVGDLLGLVKVNN